ncbi:MAG: protein-glutamate O-methyltransferase CheR [Deltaproteobacteria bacterium]|nr:protein-glutamate O-methyltransferase CheR [Deltaproteobacteria bacterium]
MTQQPAKRIPSKDFVIIRDLIRERTGIHIRDTRVDYLEYRLLDRMAAVSISTFEEYYYFLKYSPTNSGEFQQLVNLITVQETSFFRNHDQLKSFRDVLLKETFERKKQTNDKTLKIWSAACSTGEEPVTLGIILHEAMPLLSTWTAQIMATDISTRALSLARKGIFPGFRFTDMQKEIVDKYFYKRGEEYAAKESVMNMINFAHLNLLTEIDMHASRLAPLDFVFCRNVFIYFPDDVQEKIAAKFLRLLAPGGFLLLGNAESVDVRKVPFAMRFHPGGMVYQKPAASGEFENSLKAGLSV